MRPNRIRSTRLRQLSPESREQDIEALPRAAVVPPDGDQEARSRDDATTVAQQDFEDVELARGEWKLAPGSDRESRRGSHLDGAQSDSGLDDPPPAPEKRAHA